MNLSQTSTVVNIIYRVNKYYMARKELVGSDSLPLHIISPLSERNYVVFNTAITG